LSAGGLGVGVGGFLRACPLGQHTVNLLAHQYPLIKPFGALHQEMVGPVMPPNYPVHHALTLTITWRGSSVLVSNL
jgi:hypothetical protein